jgi:hypothetical protein
MATQVYFKPPLAGLRVLSLDGQVTVETLIALADF